MQAPGNLWGALFPLARQGFTHTSGGQSEEEGTASGQPAVLPCSCHTVTRAPGAASALMALGLMLQRDSRGETGEQFQTRWTKKSAGLSVKMFSLQWTEFQICKVKPFWSWFRTMWTYLTLLNCALKTMLSFVSFTTIYYRKKKLYHIKSFPVQGLLWWFKWGNAYKSQTSLAHANALQHVSTAIISSSLSGGV